ncbi:E1 ubiquitin-activating protein uba2 [Tilletia horrida]|nr:E1 ubiquitin-activating protein uba2 [Tilletia horrida]
MSSAGVFDHPAHAGNGAMGNGTDAAAAARYAYAATLLGPETFQRMQTAKILVVGAGGIGCELLKNLVLAGFSNIEIIDLDTIDLSNLNRQFLFQKQHIKQPKSLVARATALQFNPHVSIVAHHANIKEPRFGAAYFRQFDVVLNALDNIDARRWVNRMCIATGVPLVESGTTGFIGQVQPINPGKSSCYDCESKETPKTFPVCTIRSTPSNPIHCIVWAKSWLFVQLFGADDESEDEELDKALQEGENKDEIAALRNEAAEMRAIRKELIDAVSKASTAATREEDAIDISDEVRAAVRRVFDKVFKQDTERLLRMESMWTHREKPIPLDFEQAKLQTEVVAPAADPQALASKRNGEGSATASTNGQPADGAAASRLRDQQMLSLKDIVELFERSTATLALRAARSEESLSWDKDDPPALDFVTAASNLRSHVYSIQPQKSKFEVKQMAGNIIPAIASTNAIVAGILVLQAIHVLRADWNRAKCCNLSRVSGRIVTIFTPLAPNPECGVCADAYVELAVDPQSVTLRQVLADVVRAPRAAGGLAYGSGGDFDEDLELELSAYEGTRLLLDPDFDDNADKTLSDLGLTLGKTLTVVDEDDKWVSVNVLIGEVPLTAELADRANQSWVLRGRIPTIGLKPQPKKQAEEDEDDQEIEVVENVAPTIAGKKRSAAELEEEAGAAAETETPADEEGATRKRRRTTGGPKNGEPGPATDDTSAGESKRARKDPNAVGSSADDAIELD